MSRLALAALLGTVFCLREADVRPRAEVMGLPRVGCQLSRAFEREAQAFSLELAAGELLSARLRQEGIDLRLLLAEGSPAQGQGQTLAVFDNWSGADGRYGTEKVLWLAAKAGSYRLVVDAADLASSPGGLPPKGRYRLEMDPIRRADPRDRAAAAAEKAIVEGDAAASQNTAVALAHYRAAVASLEAHGDLARIADVSFRIAELLAAQGDPQAAASYRRALELYREVGNDRQLALSHHHLGYLLASQGAKRQAQEAYHQALPLWRQVGDRRGEAMTQNELGVLARNLGDGRAAIEHYDRALAIWQDLADRRQISRTLHNRGRLYAFLGRDAQALRDLHRALQMRRELGLRAEMASSSNSLGFLYARRAEWATARSLFSEVIRAAEQPRAAFVAAIGLATVERERGDLAATRRALDRAQELLPSQDPALRASLAAGEGYWALAAGQASAAQRHFGVAADLAHHLEDLAALADISYGLGLAARDQGFPKQALAHFRLAVDRAEQLRARAADQADWRADFFAHQQRYFDVWIRQALAVDPQAAAETFLASERARARSLLDLLSGATAVPVPSLGEIQAELDEGTWLLEYRLAEPQSQLWLISRHHAEVWPLPKRAEIELLAGEIANLLATPRRRSQMRLEYLQRELGRILLEPLGKVASDARRVLVVKDGNLLAIPFAPLIGPGQEAPLIDQVELVELPSAATLVALRRRGLGASQPLACRAGVVGDPVFGSEDARVVDSATKGVLVPELELPRLPYSATEAQSLLGHFSATERFGALGFAADRAALARAGKCQILHLATHTLFDDSQPERSRILFSQLDAQGNPTVGAALYPWQVASLELEASLVVLSACRTALGKRLRGEGLWGFGHAFLAAGAPRLVVSLWDVDDQATAALMAAFYQALLVDHLPPAAALRHAQLAIRREPAWSHPYFWSGFVLQGDWRPWHLSAANRNSAGN